ncbi:amino acid ABC transporter ATP-binding/permease protein [Hespellia stercorisuis]|uniref:ATP-binding cassette, subfamily C n=1 Tax=Hespellia stercorisuis DSM 15480 TaxID=1121950 RepID=A0A1M6IAE3_9FIRM|nr:ABC transporter ATP-binding protein [Hespellia stercorisuis]SHJ31424.1 ATP-binding cassette, subfamily C [Hespellia stercorisuis DSM 15480]
MSKETENRRSGFQIMKSLITLVKPLLPVMCVAVFFGVIGYLCAIFLTILAGYGIIHTFLENMGVTVMFAGGGPLLSMSLRRLFLLLVVLAVCRGIFHYAEQYCNHFIAFKLLAIIRNKVFAALRKLCPAKLEGRQKGNLISIITTDIELLEVFYAHTISPIAIAVVTSVIMTIFIGHYSVWAGVIALLGYLVVGVVIPLMNGRDGGEKGMNFRNAFGAMNSFMLDSLRGLDETIQYGKGQERKEAITGRSRQLGVIQEDLSRLEGEQRSFTNLVVLLFSFAVLFLMIFQYQNGNVDFMDLVLAVISMMGSFGPVIALSNLSNNLNQTLASGERVLSILEEEPLVEEIADDKTSDYQGDKAFLGAGAEHVTFAYDEEKILEDYSLQIEPGKITGIHGSSGSGKSTLLKLLMRFWNVDDGKVLVSGSDVQEIPTKRLRDTESYVTQETHLFHDSIANNIAVGKPGAGREEVIEAAKKASIHDFIMSLPNGYDTEVGELGDTLSGGEKQRIGIARAFLHDAPLLLMDEPTSNLDSLNEGIILKSLKEACERKTVVLVSHRKSTMNVADVVWEMESGRIS